MLIIEPACCLRMIGTTCLQAMMVPRRLMALTRSKASSVISVGVASPPARLTPTLLCSTSMRPHSLAGGDATPTEITEEAFDRVNAINLRGTIMACKHVVPIMRQQQAGSIINISSVAALTANYPTVAYKTTKAGMIAFTEQLAYHNAEYGVRVNAILPGLMNTPMAVDTRARTWGKSRAEVEALRNARVPLRKRMGTAWDVAYAALFLASDEANFITGISLLVDGGGSLRKE